MPRQFETVKNIDRIIQATETKKVARIQRSSGRYEWANLLEQHAAMLINPLVKDEEALATSMPNKPKEGAQKYKRPGRYQGVGRTGQWRPIYLPPRKVLVEHIALFSNHNEKSLQALSYQQLVTLAKHV
jgi:hypothetical protein